MAFRVGVGESDFAYLRQSGKYYVDKTDIIYELVEETEHKVTLFTRPRRFGKTLMMSMMSNFFSIKKDSKDIFAGLKITEQKEFCEKWMNQYPVLFISFKDVEGEAFQGAYDMLKARISDVCIKCSDLREDMRVNKNDAAVFDRLEAQSGNFADVKNSLKTIMRMMHAVYGKKVILLIDEYDVPIAKESIFTGANNFAYYSILDERFSRYFGFTEDEVEKY